MDPNRFDSISRLFAERRFSRRQAVRTGSAGIAAGALAGAGVTAMARAQEATPAPVNPIIPPEQGPVTKTEYLFVQSFQRGSITAKANDGPGDHTITLEAGLGQTIYFSDRPERIVGATPTLDFLRGLGFPEENPPNAALLIDAGDGTQEIAVVELFNPHYDPATATATYDLRVLEQWESGLTFADQPKDLAELTTEFGTAHLFIDDCASRAISCASADGEIWMTFPAGEREFCSYWGTGCYPCVPGGWGDIPQTTEAWTAAWNEQCTQMGTNLNGTNYCEDGCYVIWEEQAVCPPGEFQC